MFFLVTLTLSPSAYTIFTGCIKCEIELGGLPCGLRFFKLGLPHYAGLDRTQVTKTWFACFTGQSSTTYTTVYTTLPCRWLAAENAKALPLTLPCTLHYRIHDLQLHRPKLYHLHYRVQINRTINCMPWNAFILIQMYNYTFISTETRFAWYVNLSENNQYFI